MCFRNGIAQPILCMVYLLINIIGGSILGRIFYRWFFVFFWGLGFTALSRIFHYLYRADRSSKVGAKTGEPGGKTT